MLTPLQISESKKEVLQELIPNLKIEILHSKVTPKETEKIMLEFEEGKIDLLLSTSIIESRYSSAKSKYNYY